MTAPRWGAMWPIDRAVRPGAQRRWQPAVGTQCQVPKKEPRSLRAPRSRTLWLGREAVGHEVSVPGAPLSLRAPSASTSDRGDVGWPTSGCALAGKGRSGGAG
jgi:hypothetical protein